MRKTKISDEQADALKQGVFPEEKNVKCYTHCIFEMLQFVSLTLVSQKKFFET